MQGRPISVCSVLTPTELDELETLGQRLTLDKGQTLFGQGEPAGAVYNVIDGTLRLSRLLPDGRRQVMGFALPGDFLGLALQDVRSVSAEALGPVRTCRFARKDFDALVEAKPHLLRSLHERAGHELALAQEQMLLLGAAPRRRRSPPSCSACATATRGPAAAPSRSSCRWAARTWRIISGVTIETVSRMLTRLDRAHTILIVPGGVRLVDVERLEQLAAT